MSLDLNQIDQEWDKLKSDFMEFAQGPSDFQIEVFMARGEGSPDQLPVHAYRHMLAQVRPTLSEMRRLKLDETRLRRKLEDMEKALTNPVVPVTGTIYSPREIRIFEYARDPDLDLLMEETKHALEDNIIGQKGKEDQLRVMNNILDYIRGVAKGDLTNLRLQAEEWKYWMMRLARQAINSAEGASSGIGSGNLNSIRNAIEGSPLPDSPQRIPGIPMEINALRALACGDESVIEFLVSNGQRGQLPAPAEYRRSPEPTGEGDPQ